MTWEKLLPGSSSSGVCDHKLLSTSSVHHSSTLSPSFCSFHKVSFCNFFFSFCPFWVKRMKMYLSWKCGDTLRFWRNIQVIKIRLIKCSLLFSEDMSAERRLTYSCQIDFTPWLLVYQIQCSQSFQVSLNLCQLLSSPSHYHGESLLQAI